MVALLLLGLASSAVGLTRALEAIPIINPRLFPSNYTATCQTIAKSVSGVYYLGRVLAQLELSVYANSNVEPKGHPLYQKGNSHWASSSNQKSACVVEPENAEDVSTIVSNNLLLTSQTFGQVLSIVPQLRIVANTSTPFGIRSGGHATNPGFSSTPGVQIALFKLSEVTYHLGSTAADGSVGTVNIGSGLVWDDVYNALQPHDVTVVGGRVSGVGVGGFTLGGGYSWLSNQYGLTIDTVTAFEVVLPNGTIATATETVNPDLFFGLKGGFNNFGVVTKFTLLAFPQGQVWGGLRTFTFDQIPRINNATVDFINGITDPKAGIITTYNYLLGQASWSWIYASYTGIFELTIVAFEARSISTHVL
ncbi:hypothetical protein FRC09_001150 [Ceratobasidium sp. 395]|nr:hypothetical protein FRC09_001150 [Ceratobasidium sp. 395]